MALARKLFSPKGEYVVTKRVVLGKTVLEVGAVIPAASGVRMHLLSKLYLARLIEFNGSERAKDILAAYERQSAERAARAQIKTKEAETPKIIEAVEEIVVVVEEEAPEEAASVADSRVVLKPEVVETPGRGGWFEVEVSFGGKTLSKKVQGREAKDKFVEEAVKELAPAEAADGE